MNKRLKLVTSLAMGLTLFGLAPAHSALKVSSIYDGDTFTLSSGERVRLLQIDTPELSPKECYGIEAKALLVKLSDLSHNTCKSSLASEF